MLEAGRLEHCEDGYRAALDRYERVGQGLGVPSLCAARATVAVLKARPDDALLVVDAAITCVYRPGWEERADLPELMRIKGWALRLKGDATGAEREYLASLEAAREQCAKSLELRTATSYAGLLKDQGRRKEAIELLEPVYAWFTEGRSTRDHLEAAALLEELRQTG
jgi:tetratricopeptide (TPR) repeat protein